MSSHHIIREDQEAALIVANGEACSSELLNQLLEWSPYVVVLDGALHRVVNLGIKFNTVLGDMDSISDAEQLLSDYQPINLVHAPDQDKTDLEKGVEYLIEKGHRNIHLVWATGKRLDHAINNIITMAKYADRCTIVLFDDHSRAYCIPRKFSKYFNKGANISLFPMNQCHNIYTQGLKYNLQGEKLNLPDRTGSSNETLLDGTVSITYEGGQLVLMECYD
jgi:thiamine pyrophosphokinase